MVAGTIKVDGKGKRYAMPSIENQGKASFHKLYKNMFNVNTISP